MKSELRNIGGTCTIIVGVFGNNAGYPMSTVILNNSAGTIYLGHAGVTTSNGFPLATSKSISIDTVNEPMYAVATVTTSVNVLRRGD